MLVDEISNVLPNRIWHDERYEINNRILAACMGLNLDSGLGDLNFSGFNTAKKTIGYVLLTHFSSLALNINRLPFCKDRITYVLTPPEEKCLSKILEKISDDQIREIVDELKGLYEYTQNIFSSSNVRTIKLYRHISVQDENRMFVDKSYYTMTLYRYIQAAKYLGLDVVELEMDMLNSYTSSDIEYFDDITIFTELDVKDIFYSSRLVSSPHHPSLIESNEWVLINPAPSGLVSIPTSDVTLNVKHFNNYFELDEARAKSIISEYQPLPLRYEYHTETYGGCGVIPTRKRKLLNWLVKKLKE